MDPAVLFQPAVRIGRLQLGSDLSQHALRLHRVPVESGIRQGISEGPLHVIAEDLVRSLPGRRHPAPCLDLRFHPLQCGARLNTLPEHLIRNPELFIRRRVLHRRDQRHDPRKIPLHPVIREVNPVMLQIFLRDHALPARAGRKGKQTAKQVRKYFRNSFAVLGNPVPGCIFSGKKQKAPADRQQKSGADQRQDPHTVLPEIVKEHEAHGQSGKPGKTLPERLPPEKPHRRETAHQNEKQPGREYIPVDPESAPGGHGHRTVQHVGIADPPQHPVLCHQPQHSLEDQRRNDHHDPQPHAVGDPKLHAQRQKQGINDPLDQRILIVCAEPLPRRQT